MKRVVIFTIITLAILVLITPFVISEEFPPEVEWEKTYDNSIYDNLRAGAVTDDGGFIFVGDTYIFTSIAVNGSNYVYLAEVHNPHAWIVKTNYGGIVEWNITRGGPFQNGIIYPLKPNLGDDIDMARDVQQTTDGGYIVMGESEFFANNGVTDVSLIKLRSDGKLEWHKTFDSPKNNSQEYGYSVLEVDEGNYLLTGQIYEPDDDKSLWIIKTDSEGKKIWDKTYDASGSNSKILSAVDEGYIILSKFGDFLKIDFDGNTVWKRSVRKYGCGEEFSSVVNAIDGYIISGSCIIKTDLEGNLSWIKKIPQIPSYVTDTKDGNYLITGKGARGDNLDAFLIKINESGDVIWEKILGKPFGSFVESRFTEEGIFAKQLDNGDYIFAGNVLKYPQNSSNNDIDFWVVKLSINKTCEPSWQCSDYGSCLNGSQDCDASMDSNSCGKTYLGDYSEFDSTACSICGNNACDSDESCSSCSSDCGICPDSSSSNSGGGGSSSSKSKSSSSKSKITPAIPALTTNLSTITKSQDTFSAPKTEKKEINLTSIEEIKESTTLSKITGAAIGIAEKSSIIIITEVIIILIIITYFYLTRKRSTKTMKKKKTFVFANL